VFSVTVFTSRYLAAASSGFPYCPGLSHSNSQLTACRLSLSLDWCSRSLLKAIARHDHSWHRAQLRPTVIYLFNVKTFVVFFLLSLFLPLVKKGLVFLYRLVFTYHTLFRLRLHSFSSPQGLSRKFTHFTHHSQNKTQHLVLTYTGTSVRTLRLIVSQSVSLGVEPHLGLMTRYLLLFDSYGLALVRRPLWREDGSVFCIYCWPLPAQSFLGPSPLGLATIFYCLRFKTSLFVASYYSQCHGGGIWTRLHTGTPAIAAGPL
jgi:hypothetical protein